jgi:hypothetical protein
LNRKRWRAANLFQPRAIILHGRVILEPGTDFTKDVGCMGIWRFYDAVMDPFALPASGNHSSSSQIGKMTRNFRLVCLQNFDKETDTNFVLPNQVYEAQTRSIRERLKKKSDAIFFAAHFVPAWSVRSLIITILANPEFLFPGRI